MGVFIFWFILYWTFWLFRILNAPYSDRTIRSPLLIIFCFPSKGVVNPDPLMNLVLLQKDFWIGTPFLSFLKLVSILDISLSSRFLVFRKAHKPRKCWRWCLSKFEYILIVLFPDCSIACRTILQTPYRGAYISDIGNGLETDQKRRWNGLTLAQVSVTTPPWGGEWGRSPPLVRDLVGFLTAKLLIFFLFPQRNPKKYMIVSKKMHSALVTHWYIGRYFRKAYKRTSI